MRLRVLGAGVLLVLGGCTGIDGLHGDRPLIRGSLGAEKHPGETDPKTEPVAVLRVELSSLGLENDVAAYGSAGCYWLDDHPETDALLYLIHIPEDTLGQHPEVTYPFAVHRSQCVVTQ